MQRLLRLRRGVNGRQAFVLYLDARTWQGSSGQQLAGAVGDVLRAGFPLLLLHECDPQRGGCEFARFFTTGALPPFNPNPTRHPSPLALPKPQHTSTSRP